MIRKPMWSRNTKFLRVIEEKATSQKVEEDEKNQQESLVSGLPKDCIFNILVGLPIESLQRSKFVCKLWFNMIGSSAFINAHFNHADTCLIFLVPIRSERLNPFSVTSMPQEKPKTFFVEENLVKYSTPIFWRIKSNFKIQYMEVNGGRSKIVEFYASCLGFIRASCNGLVLLDNIMKKGGLILINPVTRKLVALSVGTVCHDESYGFGFSARTGEYKVVHLFRDESGFIGCELLDIKTRSWRAVDGPASGLFGGLDYKPVAAIGALHWVPHLNYGDYIVSIDMDSEKFQKIQLPRSYRNYDGILEMGGFLCFVTHEEINQVDIWILTGLRGESWIKLHSIRVNYIKDMAPIFCSRMNGEMIFRKNENGLLYAYDFELLEMREIEMKKGFSPLTASYFPHVNTLISWDTERKV